MTATKSKDFHSFLSMNVELPLLVKSIGMYSGHRVFSLRFLYNRLALVIHRDSHLLSMTLPWQLLSVIKVEIFYQILHFKI